MTGSNWNARAFLFEPHRTTRAGSVGIDVVMNTLVVGLLVSVAGFKDSVSYLNLVCLKDCILPLFIGFVKAETSTPPPEL